MPQMAPMSWLTLFVLFSMALMMFSIMNYYSYLPKTKETEDSSNLITNKMNWKW
uniref:ATP synthase F0 subunit 8 n=1 Tax=Prodasineura croconota TaxID=1407214 RepID=UPI0030FE148B